MSVVRYVMRQGSYHIEMHGRTNKPPCYILREWRTLELRAAQCEFSPPAGFIPAAPVPTLRIPLDSRPSFL